MGMETGTADGRERNMMRRGEPHPSANRSPGEQPQWLYQRLSNQHPKNNMLDVFSCVNDDPAHRKQIPDLRTHEDYPGRTRADLLTRDSARTSLDPLLHRVNIENKFLKSASRPSQTRQPIAGIEFLDFFRDLVWRDGQSPLVTRPRHR
jgi:hypothetical protein